MTTEELQKNGKTLLILLACVVVLAGLAFWAEPEQKGINQTTDQEISSANGDIVDLGGYYTKDKNNVYRYGEIIPNSDPATFQVP